MKLKGNYSDDVTYNVGDVVKYSDDVVYLMQHPCPAGVPPVETRYWGRVGDSLNDIVLMVMDALEIESGNNPKNLSEDALILKSVTPDSDKEFIITVDDDGELTATELTSEG